MSNVFENSPNLKRMTAVLDEIASACRIVTGVSLIVPTVIFGWLVFGR